MQDLERLDDSINDNSSHPYPIVMPTIDPSIEKYPHCIVWTPIPCISWVLPFIGHTGIGDSQGVIHDFAGPYHIGVGSLAFGRPTRYIELDPANCSLVDWDSGLKEGCEIYKGRMHNLLLDNCHSHVAQCLNLMGYRRSTGYNMAIIAIWVFLAGKFVDVGSFVKTYAPFTIILLLLLFASGVIPGLY
mmetsp:Transcript_28183/g.47404  ORF Transcript_28183/g.47404 Transcript_28183/m.47404 type:complete len:188 (-) Transcript_28183:174-737(-)